MSESNHSNNNNNNSSSKHDTSTTKTIVDNDQPQQVNSYQIQDVDDSSTPAPAAAAASAAAADSTAAAAAAAAPAAARRGIDPDAFIAHNVYTNKNAAAAGITTTTATAAATGTINQPNRFVLPNGEEINSKNTLQSFDNFIVPSAVPSSSSVRTRTTSTTGVTTRTSSSSTRGKSQHLSSTAIDTDSYDNIVVPTTTTTTAATATLYAEPVTTSYVIAQAEPYHSVIDETQLPLPRMVGPPRVATVQQEQEKWNRNAKKYTIIGTITIVIMIILIIIIVVVVKNKSSALPAETLVPTSSPTIYDPLQMACNFLGYTNSTTDCLRATTYYSADSISTKRTTTAGVTTIPTEIGVLQQLTYLHLSHKGLSGTIPTTAFNELTKLEVLDLSENTLSGTIPTNAFNQLTELRILSLSSNTLTGTIPSTAFQQLTNLEYLFLGYNALIGTIPSTAFQQLTNLIALQIQNNTGLMGTIPDELCINIPAGMNNKIYIDCERITCTCCKSGTLPGNPLCTSI